MKEYAKKFYKSTQWIKCRNAYYKLKHGLCERCSGIGKIVHHKEYITPSNINDLNITLSFDNLELLCQDCHNKEHHGKWNATADGLRFDENGMLIQT